MVACFVERHHSLFIVWRVIADAVDSQTLDDRNQTVARCAHVDVVTLMLESLANYI